MLKYVLSIILCSMILLPASLRNKDELNLHKETQREEVTTIDINEIGNYTITGDFGEFITFSDSNDDFHRYKILAIRGEGRDIWEVIPHDDGDNKKKANLSKSTTTLINHEVRLVTEGDPLIIKNDDVFILEDFSKIIVLDQGALQLKDNAQLLIKHNSTLEIKENGSLRISPDAAIFKKNSAKFINHSILWTEAGVYAVKFDDTETYKFSFFEGNWYQNKPTGSIKSIDTGNFGQGLDGVLYLDSNKDVRYTTFFTQGYANSKRIPAADMKVVKVGDFGYSTNGILGIKENGSLVYRKTHTQPWFPLGMDNCIDVTAVNYGNGEDGIAVIDGNRDIWLKEIHNQGSWKKILDSSDIQITPGSRVTPAKIASLWVGELFDQGPSFNKFAEGLVISTTDNRVLYKRFYDTHFHLIGDFGSKKIVSLSKNSFSANCDGITVVLDNGTVYYKADIYQKDWSRMRETGIKCMVSGHFISSPQTKNISSETISGKSQTKTDDSESIIFSDAKASPNPFNPATNISFELKESAKVSLDIINVKGELVKSLINRKLSAGMHSARFNAQNLNSGMYFYRLKAKNQIKMRKVILVK